MQNCERASLVCSNYFQIVLIPTCAIVARESRARDELIDRRDDPQLNHYGRAGARQGTRLAMNRDIPRQTGLRGPKQEEVSWRRRARSLPESFSVHTSMGESQPAGGSPSVQSARCARGARGMTDPRPSWLTCRSTTADSRTGSARPADRVFSRTGSRSPSRDRVPPSRLADSFAAAIALVSIHAASRRKAQSNVLFLAAC